MRSSLRPQKYGTGRTRNLDNVPDILGGVAELAASNTGTKRVVADTDGIILELISERIVALGHGTDEDADALVRSKILYVVSNSHDLGVERQRDLAAVGREVVGNRVFDHLQKLLLRCSGPD